MLAYITPNEAKNLEASGGQKTMTKEGIPAYPEWDSMYGASSKAAFDAGRAPKGNWSPSGDGGNKTITTKTVVPSTDKDPEPTWGSGIYNPNLNFGVNIGKGLNPRDLATLFNSYYGLKGIEPDPLDKIPGWDDTKNITTPNVSVDDVTVTTPDSTIDGVTEVATDKNFLSNITDIVNRTNNQIIEMQKAGELKKGGRVGALGGGIMHAKRGLVNAPGGYAGEKEEVDFGGITEAVTAVEKTPKKFLVDKLEVTVMPGQSEEMAIVNAMINDTDGVMPDDRKQEFYRLYLPQLRASGEISETEYNGLMGELFNKANGGRINKAGGGISSVLPKGKEADYRGGGVIPIGSRERADDVPARLSKNEFVMTADAVKAAGGGSVNKGAKRMYNLMHNLEARV